MDLFTLTPSCHKYPTPIPNSDNPCQRFGVFGGILASLTYQVLPVYKAFIHGVLWTGLTNVCYGALPSGLLRFEDEDSPL